MQDEGRDGEHGDWQIDEVETREEGTIRRSASRPDTLSDHGRTVIKHRRDGFIGPRISVVRRREGAE